MKRVIITAAELPESGELLVPYDAVLTPLARDEVERRGIIVKEVAAADATRVFPADYVRQCAEQSAHNLARPIDLLAILAERFVGFRRYFDLRNRCRLAVAAHEPHHH